MIENVLVTGCTRGLGRALALRLAEENCHVYAVGRDADLLQELAQLSPRIQPIVANIGTDAGRQAIFNQVDKTKPLSIIHNAAISKPSLFESMTEERLREHFEINYFAPTLITQHFLPLLAGGQRVLSISSGAADMALPGLLAYCTTKSTLEHTSRCLNAEFNQRGIYFGNLRPGMIDTPMQTKLRNTAPEALPNRDFYIQAEKDNKLAQPEAVAEFVISVLLKTKDAEFAEKLWNIYDESHRAIASPRIFPANKR